MFVFLIGWIFIHVLTKKSFLITSQVALNDPFIGQKLWGGPASPREEPLGSHCCQVDRLALETPLEQPQPRAGPSGPLGPWLRDHSQPPPTPCSWHSGKVGEGGVGSQRFLPWALAKISAFPLLPWGPPSPSQITPPGLSVLPCELGLACPPPPRVDTALDAPPPLPSLHSPGLIVTFLPAQVPAWWAKPTQRWSGSMEWPTWVPRQTRLPNVMARLLCMAGGHQGWGAWDPWSPDSVPVTSSVPVCALPGGVASRREMW